MRNLVVLIIVVLSAAACSIPTVKEPPATATTTTAPPVLVPRSTAQFAKRPCDLLVAEELAELGLSVGRQRQTVGAEECRWKARTGDDLGLTPDDRRNVLDDAYRAPWRGVSAAGQLQGYPSLRRKTGTGDLNICTVIVGVGPNASLTADWVGTGPPGGDRDACVLAEQAVTFAIRKLPPAS